MVSCSIKYLVGKKFKCQFTSLKLSNFFSSLESFLIYLLYVTVDLIKLNFYIIRIGFHDTFFVLVQIYTRNKVRSDDAK